VTFWGKVYTEYSNHQEIIHDDMDLGVIYEVIDLEKENTRTASIINQNRVVAAKEKYRAILRKLISDTQSNDPDAKRVAALFGPEADKARFQRALGQIRCQSGQKERFREGIARSGAYIESIKDIFRSFGLPVDLAYLPHVESSFDREAYSKYGATGIWQFTHKTGKRFMNIDTVLDERWDPIQSTHAAARLLKENYEQLGNWPLAITAYNHGVEGMMEAKKRKGSYPAIFREYWSRTFKFASRNFYSEFLAALEAAKAPEQYFGQVELDPPFKCKEVLLEGFVSFRDLARYFNLDLAILRDFNPALRKPVLSGEKYVPMGYTLRLPEDHEAGIMTVCPALPASLFRAEQKRVRIYQVRKGETVYSIARRHGVTAEDVILANNLSPKAVIYPKQIIHLPTPEEKSL